MGLFLVLAGSYCLGFLCGLGWVNVKANREGRRLCAEIRRKMGE